MVTIRLQRKGKRNRPFYRIVVAQSSRARNGKTLDSIGYYNPLVKPTEIKFDAEKLQKWVSVGAQMSDTVKRLTSAPAPKAKETKVTKATKETKETKEKKK
jgi:small subunit ribosomal protein S16